MKGGAEGAMAEFCNQCAAELDFDPDFVGLTTAEDWEKGVGRVVPCEGCGVTIVDPEGNCVTDCLRHHRKR
jgi:hypothetical protein